MMRFFREALWVLVAVVTLCGCARRLIPNTDVEDSPTNRQTIEFVEEYRRAVEARNVKTLIDMVSPQYYDDNGTPSGEDDVDFDALKVKLSEWRQAVVDARYEIRYRRVTRKGQRVWVDFTYTGSFRIKTPEGEKWSRRLADNRLVLIRDPATEEYRILSGM